jgi:parallel beta-helix repeat protein
VVYISKTVTIRGGYTTADWDTFDPDANQVTLDAQRQGRVFYVSGSVSPRLEGLRATGADDSGIYAVTATVTISRCWIYSNTDGGVELVRSPAELTDNVIQDNVAAIGAGVYLFYSDATLEGNVIQGNTAQGNNGGGLYAWGSDLVLRRNAFQDNAAHTNGGGVSLLFGTSTLTGNVVEGNSCQSSGGGIALTGDGAFSPVTLTNNVIVDNEAGSAGSGVFVSGALATMLHTTIARNSGGDGSGVSLGPFCLGSCYSATVMLTNTILVSHSVGISAAGGTTAVVNGVLWHSTPVTVSQSPTATVMVQNQHTGAPDFMADGYRLGPWSAAIDAGIDAGVLTDVDGDPRPVDGDLSGVAAMDLGADEAQWQSRLYLPLVMR